MVMGELTQETEVLVIGGGPAGYAAAFRAADLGMDVTMVDMEARPGGECLYRGCIPSKTLLHLAELLNDSRRAETKGIKFHRPRIDLEALRDWKDKVIEQLATGLVTLTHKRGIQLLQGHAVFDGSDTIRLTNSEVSHIKFRHAILATGSRPISMPGIPFKAGGRVMDSAGILELQDIPDSLLIFGGGYIALEMGTVYASLGTRVTIAVRSDRFLRAADQDLTSALISRLGEDFKSIYFNTRIASVKEHDKGVDVTFSGDMADPSHQTFDRMLIAIGREPNSLDIGLETTKVTVDEKGFVIVDEQLRTSDERIFAVGDVAGGPLLAHKAFHEGKVAAEAIAGKPSAFDAYAIPAIVYTDPQVAWCGLTEQKARKENIPVKVERFPWKYSSRAVTMDATDGLTKVVIDPDTGRIIGVGISGRNSEGMISEGVLAIEMGALVQDLGMSIHPHPTLSETLAEAAEIFLGTVTHMLPKKSE